MEIRKQMTVLEDKINLDKFVFDNNNRKRISCSCLGQTCFRSLIVFLSKHLFILLIIFGCFGEFTFKELLTEKLFGLDFCAVRHDTFYLHQFYEPIISTKNRVFFSLGGPSETGKSQLIYKWLKVGTLQLKFDRIYFFNSTFPALLRCYAK